MVAGLPKILEHGALNIVTSLKSAFHSSTSTDRRSILRASVMGMVVPMVRHSLRVERTDRGTSTEVEQPPAQVEGVEEASAPVLRCFHSSTLIPYFASRELNSGDTCPNS